MTNVIRFRTREELEQEKKDKMLAESEAYLGFKEEALKKAKLKEKDYVDTQKEK